MGCLSINSKGAELSYNSWSHPTGIVERVSSTSND